MAKKNVIKDYKTMTPELMALLVAEYPEGFEYETVYFTNAKGEKVEAVPLETEDTKYLIKVSTSLERQFEAFDLEEFESDSDGDGTSEDFEAEELDD